MAQTAPVPTTAAAQPIESSSASAAGDALAEVLVTAQRRTQNIQDVPASITAVSGAELEKRQVTSINSLNVIAPNVQVSPIEGPGTPAAFTIRGISSTDFSPNQSRPIAFYIDEGIRQMAALEAMPLFDINDLEVLRGPQGALYGKNATGGAVIVSTQQPGFDTSGYISAGYGNYNQIESNGAVQIPILDDKLAARIAYTYTHNDGVIQQLGPGGNLEQTDVAAVRASLRFRPTEDLDFVLRYNHYSAGGRNLAVYAYDINFTAVGYPTLDTLPGAHRQGLSYFQNNNDYIGYRSIRIDNLNNQIKWRLAPGITLLSITTYDTGYWHESEDDDGLPLNAANGDLANANNIEQFVQELRLTGDMNRLQWLAGAFYSHDSVAMLQWYPYFMEPRCPECYTKTGAIGFSQTNSFDQKRDSYSGYGRIEYEFTDTLSAAAGVRWSEDQVRLLNYNAWNGDSSTGLFNPNGQTIANLNDSNTFHNTSAEATLTYKPTTDVLTYVSFKQGYRTGAFNAQAFEFPEEVDFVKPETADNFEAGLKTVSLERRMTFNFTGFYTKYYNQQIASVEVNAAGNTIFPLRSIPRARIYGGEAELILRATDGLTFNLAGGYTNGKYIEGTVAGDNVAGHQMAALAPWSGSLAADWRIAHLAAGSVNLHADAALQSREFFDVHQTPAVSDPGHAVTNMQLSYDGPQWTVALWATNLLDAKYLAYAINESSIGWMYGVRGTPRAYGFRVKLSF
jgi:outer membrane receptor protein involved in Fe transport